MRCLRVPVLFVALFAAAGAQAQVADCNTLTNPTYVIGSSAISPLVQRLAPLVAETTTLVYQSSGSCNGVKPIVGSTNMTGNGKHYDASGTASDCVLPTDRVADVGISDVFVETCGLAKPATVGDFLGPIQAMLFVAPKASSATAITQEEAYFVYGFGGRLTLADGSTVPLVSPWTSTSSIWRRDETSGTEEILAYAMFPPALTNLSGNQPGMQVDAALPDSQKASGSSGMISKVGTDPSPNAAIGLLAADQYDGVDERSTLKSLAFRGYGQKVAFWADSTPTSFDKRNVRDGRYLPFGPLHLVTKINTTSGRPISTNAANFVDWIQGAKTITGGDIVDLEIESNVIPACAMNVERTAEGGELTPATGPSCGCYFDANVAGGSAACTTCTNEGGACGTGGVCRRGYCDVR